MLVAALAALLVIALPAAAAEPPPDAVPFEVGFPIEGPAEFRDSFGDPREPDRLHAGQDLLAPKGTPVLAAVPGVVTRIGSARLSGVFVEIAHDGGWATRYLHLDNDTPGTDDGAAFGVAPELAVGSWVDRGTVVGFVGDSGNAESTVPHLHFELRDPLGRAVNVYPFLVGRIPEELEILPEGPLTPLADGFTIAGSIDPGGGFHGSLTVLGSRAYIGSYGTEDICPGTGVTVIDVQNPAAPAVAGAIGAHAGRWVTALASAVVDGRDFLAVASASCTASDDAGITIYDVTDLEAPRALSVIQTAADVTGVDLGESAGSVLLAATTPGAFVTSGARDVVVYDVADPSAPRPVAAWDFRADLPAYVLEGAGADTDPERFSAHDVAIAEGRAFVASDDAGVVVLDISDPAVPAYRGRTATTGAPDGGARSVTVSGSTVVVGYGDGSGEALIFDVAGPGDPILLETLSERSTEGVAASPDHIVVAAGGDGVVLVEASHGTTHTFRPPPTEDPNEHFGLHEGTRFYPQVWQALVREDLVYVLDVNTGLWMVRIVGHGEAVGAR